MNNIKALIIHGTVTDMGDLLHIARSEGCKTLGCDKVTVLPDIIRRENSYVVFVAPKGVSCSEQRSCIAEELKQVNE